MCPIFRLSCTLLTFSNLQICVKLQCDDFYTYVTKDCLKKEINDNFYENNFENENYLLMSHD